MQVYFGRFRKIALMYRADFRDQMAEWCVIYGGTYEVGVPK